MGAITFSLDPRLAEVFVEALSIDVFVETGTHTGDTLANVKECFQELYSIELSDEYFRIAWERFAQDFKVRLIRGDSASELCSLTRKLEGRSVLFFLDAHWCVAEHSAGHMSQCPLLDELRCIGKLNTNSTIIIDDARLFLATPPFPHEASDWPTFDEVLSRLGEMSVDHELMVVNDNILFFPSSIRDTVARYARMQGVDWLGVLDNQRERYRELEELRRICAEREREVSDRSRELVELNEALVSRSKELVKVRENLDKGSEKLMEAQQQLVEKEKAIRILSRTLYRYRLANSIVTRTSALVRNTLRLASPKLGKLDQHPPIPLRQPPPCAFTVELEDLPTISLVTPSWKQGEFIERTIMSVLSQNYPKLEYFIQDGGSDDGTVPLVKRYLDKLEGFESCKDEGQANAVNRGFSKTTGEVMAWLNSDDMLLPGALTCIGEYFARHPEVDVIYGNRILIDANDNEIGRWILPPHNNWVLNWADFVPQETLFWRRRIWEAVGGCVDETFNFALDWDLLLRFKAVGARMVRLPRFLGAFRVHPLQKTSSEINDAGQEEMDRLRRRWAGVQDVGDRRIRKEVARYMVHHIIHDFSWRVRNRLLRLRQGVET